MNKAGVGNNGGQTMEKWKGCFSNIMTDKGQKEEGSELTQTLSSHHPYGRK